MERPLPAPSAHLPLVIRAWLYAPSTARPPGPGLTEGQSGSPSDLNPAQTL